MNKFTLGEIVTLKSHKLFIDHAPNQQRESFSIQHPPMLMIKEIFIESTDKKIFHSTIEKAKISSRVKYTCVYFNDHKSSFFELTIYEDLLESFKLLRFPRKEENVDKQKTLIEEVKDYAIATYELGKVVQLKTAKLEHRKKLKDVFKYPTFRCPELVITGIKENDEQSSFYEKSGEPKKIVSKVFFKVCWFDYVQNKIAEQYLPQEFLIEPLKPATAIPDPPKPENDDQK